MKLEKMASIDAHLRLLAPGKVSEDDKLVEYDALLLDRFLDILQALHGEDLKETVQECYELSAEYESSHDPEKLEELGNVLTSLDAGDSIVVAKSFSNMLNLANLAEEVQIAYRRRIKLKKGDFADEASATTESDIEETIRKLVRMGKTSEQVFDALKNQTVDLVFTAHPTQSVRRSLLQKHGRIRNCLTQFYAKDITTDDKKELDEALQREEVKLLGSWASPFSRRIEMALKLKGVKYEYVEEDLSNKSPLLLHYNPIHKKIPVLIHNGKAIVESLVILEYIDETWNASYPLLQSDPYGKAGARFWAKFISEQCMPALWKACASPDGELMEEAVLHLRKLEDELKGKRFFGGEAIGLVDIAACFIAHWLEAVQEARGMEKLLITKASFPRLVKWSEEFCNVDCVKENLPDKEKIVAVFKGMFAPPRPDEAGKYVPRA